MTSYSSYLPTGRSPLAGGKAVRGTGLPPVLAGARDRVYGLGPEGAMLIKPIRGQLRVRYEWDLAVRARPQGHIFVAGINFLVHRPQQPIP